MTVIVSVPLTHTEVYHPKECHVAKLLQNKREITKNEAEKWGLRKCKACTDQFGGPGAQPTKAYRLAQDNNSLDELQESINASD